MTIKEALEALRKYYGCRTTTVCGSLSDLCGRCKYDVDADTVTEALKTVLNAFGNDSEIPNTSGDMEFQRIITTESLKGTYYEIVYNRDGEKHVGYSSYSLDVISDYLKRFFMKRKCGLPNSSDLVSRSYLLAEYDRQHQGSPGGARKIIEEAPPVQAESATSTNDGAIDLIDRAEAQTELQFAARRYTVAHEANGEGQVVWSDILISVTDAMNALRKVPSVQAEQKKGHWIPVDDPSITGRCSVCGFESHLCEDDVYGYDYCPNCGARLEVIDDE